MIIEHDTVVKVRSLPPMVTAFDIQCMGVDEC